MWEPITIDEPIVGIDKIRRNVRYAALNPPRSPSLPCRDPLAWRYSSYRDLLGIAAEPWVDETSIRRAFGPLDATRASRIHAYVSADPHVDVSGTPPPASPPADAVARVPLHTIADATALAWHADTGILRRRGAPRHAFVAFARHHGWPPARIAEIAGCSLRTVRRLAARAGEPRAMRAIAICATDPRLVGLGE